MGFLAAALLDIQGPASAAPPRLMARLPPGSAVVQGTIAWTSGDGTDIILKDGGDCCPGWRQRLARRADATSLDQGVCPSARTDARWSR